MSRLKKLTALVLTLALVFAFGVTIPAQAATPISVTVDGVKIATDVAPVASGTDVLVSEHTLSDGLGAVISFKASTKEITVKFTAHTFIFKEGSTSYKFDGQAKTALTAPKIVSVSKTSKTHLLPSKAIIQNLGGTFSFKSNKLALTYFSTIKGTVKITGSTTVQPIAQAAADWLNRKAKGASISVAGGGSGTGINDTIAGSNNLGASSRVLTGSELSQIKGVYTIARDGIAIIVHPSNPIKNLTADQAKQIFLGKITNWKDVGGDDAAIIVMTRETGSGTRTTLSDLLLNKADVVATATPWSSSGTMLSAVAKNKYAIGFDSIGYVNASVKVLSLNSVMPTKTNVRYGTYLLGRALFILSKQSATGPSAMFVDFMNTKYAQSNFVNNQGYLPLK